MMLIGDAGCHGALRAGLEAWMVKVYIAGPDVFLPEPQAVGERLKGVARRHGFEPLFPLDNAVDIRASENPSLAIFEGNRAMIDAADVVVANLNAFRGAEPDSGTVWEVAYAISRGKPVIGYVASDMSMRDRVLRLEGAVGGAAKGCDRNGMSIEDFGHPLNLLLVHSLTALVVGDFDAACGVAQERLGVRLPFENALGRPRVEGAVMHGEYHGPIVSVAGRAVIQSTGRGGTVTHDAVNLSAILKQGDRAAIKYSGGKGGVTVSERQGLGRG